jgi:hypothetical protein
MESADLAADPNFTGGAYDEAGALATAETFETFEQEALA